LAFHTRVSIDEFPQNYIQGKALSQVNKKKCRSQEMILRPPNLHRGKATAKYTEKERRIHGDKFYEMQ
jgi:hypothetical protein